MELRRYWSILTRYWPVIAILTAVGLVAAILYYRDNRPTNQAVARVYITQLPSPNDTYSNLYANQASEFAADDFINIITGNVFMSQVATQLKEANINLSADELAGMVAVERKHRNLTITASNSNETVALQLARTVATSLSNNAAEYVKPRQVTATITSLPNQATPAGGRQILLALVRVIAGLLAGVGLAFLLSYLDNSVRTRAGAEETLGLPVLAAIPPVRSTQFLTAIPAKPEAAIQARLASLQPQPDSDKEHLTTR